MQTKKIVSLILFFLLATVVVAAPVLSTVPDTINFQGMLTDDNGDAVADGSYVMRFYLFDAATGGNQLWNNPDGELQTVTVTNGVYNVQLGINESLDYTIFNGGTAWLEVVVEGETLSPRQPLTSTAYALKAGDADTLAGQTLGDLNTAYVNIGETDVVTSAMVAPDTLLAADLAANSVNASEISTGAVGTLEIANGSVTAADLAEDYVNTAGDTMTGTLNLPANGLRVGTSQLVVTGDRIGLGTSSPNEQLELTGNLRLPATTSTTGIIRSGSNRFIHAYGTRNFFAGTNAGNLSMTGTDNTANGTVALYANTTGSQYRQRRPGAPFQHHRPIIQPAVLGAQFQHHRRPQHRQRCLGALFQHRRRRQHRQRLPGALYQHDRRRQHRQRFPGRSIPTPTATATPPAVPGHSIPTPPATPTPPAVTGRSIPTPTGDPTPPAVPWRSIPTPPATTTPPAVTRRSIPTPPAPNTASGSGALCSNTTGDYNTASGSEALYANTDGNSNTASGY